LCKKLILTFLEKTANFFPAEYWQKSQKIVIIASTPGTFQATVPSPYLKQLLSVGQIDRLRHVGQDFHRLQRSLLEGLGDGRRVEALLQESVGRIQEASGENDDLEQILRISYGRNLQTKSTHAGFRIGLSVFPK
jgi:hypothetical protein